MHKLWKTTLCAALTLCLTSAPALAFYPTQPSDWAAADIRAAYDSAMYAEQSYNGERNYAAPISRREFCNLIFSTLEKGRGRTFVGDSYVNEGALDSDRAGAEEAYAPKPNPFTDVEDSETGILTVYSLGIVNGTSTSTFSPDAPLTREQAAVILAKTYEVLSPGSFDPGRDIIDQMEMADAADVSSWARPGVSFTLEKVLMTSVGQSRFAPKETYTVEQAILTAYRLLQGLVPDQMAAPGSNSWLEEYGVGRVVSIGDGAVFAYCAGDKVRAVRVDAMEFGGSTKTFGRDEQMTESWYDGFKGGVYTTLSGAELERCHPIVLTLTLTLADGSAKQVTDSFWTWNYNRVA